MHDIYEISIDSLLEHNSPFMRMLAVLDKRCGKRRLKKIEIKEEHPLVERMYHFRCYCEGLTQLIDSIQYCELISTIYDYSLEKKQKKYFNKIRQRDEIAELKSHSKIKDIRSLIHKLYNDVISKEECINKYSKTLRNCLLGVADREFVYKILLHIETKSKLFRSDRFLYASSKGSLSEYYRLVYFNNSLQ